MLSVRTRSPSWFGEGDEKIYIDGEEKASIWGTGTEDYFLSAWGLKTTSTPYFGVPYFDQWGIVGGHTSAYRWHVNDPIVFNKGIKVTFEHFGWISPDENPQYKTHSWNERRGRLFERGVLVPDGRADVHGPRPARPRADAAEPGPDHRRARISRPSSITARAKPSRRTWTCIPNGHLFYKPQQPENAWVEIPFEVEKKEPLRLLLVMTRAYDYGKYQASLNGVKLGGVIDLYSPERLDPRASPAGFLARAGQVHAAAGMRGQERRLRRALPGHRVGPPAGATAPRRRVPPRRGQGLADEADAVRMTRS